MHYVIVLFLNAAEGTLGLSLSSLETVGMLPLIAAGGDGDS